MSPVPLENFTKLIAGRHPGKLSAKVACLPASPEIMHPNCRAILTNREGKRRSLPVLDERPSKIAIILDDN